MTVGLAFVIIAVLFLLIKSEGFRRIAIVLAGLLVFGAVLLYAWINHSDKDRARKREHARTLIKLSEVELIQPRLSFSSYDAGQRRTPKGKLEWQYSLKAIEAKEP